MLSFLADHSKQRLRCDTHINGVTLLHLFVDQPFPHIGAFELHLVLKGLIELVFYVAAGIFHP